MLITIRQSILQHATYRNTRICNLFIKSYPVSWYWVRPLLYRWNYLLGDRQTDRQASKQSRNKIRILDEISGSSSTNWEQIPLFCFHHFDWELQPSPFSRSTHLRLHAAGTGSNPFLVSGFRPCLQFVISPFVILLLHVLRQFKIFKILLVDHLQDGQNAVRYATLPRRVYGSHVFTALYNILSKPDYSANLTERIWKLLCRVTAERN